MADLKQLTLAGTALDVPTALNDLSDVKAPSPVAGQVLTFTGDGGIWTPQVNQAAGFPGLSALDWKNPLNVGMKKGALAISGGSFEIAKFQNQVFFRMTGVLVTSSVNVGVWYSLFTSVPPEWLPNTNNMLSIAQTYGPSSGGSLVAICAGNAPSAIWMVPIVWNSGTNNLHGIVTWYT